MINIKKQENPVIHFDIIICGGGIAGLWLLNVLIKSGFNVLLLEKEEVGGIQTIASQGMIHGGQRYMLGTNSSAHAESVSRLPDIWDACLGGVGELDLSGVRILSETQVMWPTGGRLTHLALNAASHMTNAKTRKLNVNEIPKALSGLKEQPVFELPEKVLDIASLVDVLSAPHRSHIKKGSVDSLSRDGSISVSGLEFKAQLVICAAGLGNEEFLTMLDAGKGSSQRRPLRQLMVRIMPFPLYGHGITTSYKPRVTVTSYPLSSGEYVWYLGGAIADETLSLTEHDAIAYAKNEMKDIFPYLDWYGKQWATWYGLRAEAYSPNGRLPNGPVLQEYGNALVIWPTKLTLAPLLGCKVLELLSEKGILPKFAGIPPKLDNLLFPTKASFPWEQAAWSK